MSFDMLGVLITRFVILSLFMLRQHADMLSGVLMTVSMLSGVLMTLSILRAVRLGLIMLTDIMLKGYYVECLYAEISFAESHHDGCH